MKCTESDHFRRGATPRVDSSGDMKQFGDRTEVGAEIFQTFIGVPQLRAETHESSQVSAHRLRSRWPCGRRVGGFSKPLGTVRRVVKGSQKGTSRKMGPKPILEKTWIAIKAWD